MTKEKLKNYYADLFKKYPFGKVEIKQVLKDLDELDEPQKPVVPQFVADWIEKCKSIKQFITSLAYALNSEVWSENSLSDECIDWLYKAENQDIFARAWLDGYTVEEKRYLVSLRNGQPLVRTPLGKDFYFNQNILAEKYKATRKELEQAGFGWVFDCPGVEIKEVEG